MASHSGQAADWSATGIGKKRPYKQDLPPKGGYEPINFKRVPARKLVNAPILFGGFIIYEGYQMWRLQYVKEDLHYERVEERSARIALEPMLLAERDREYLKQLVKNRDAERDLMKDVKGWEVGTWFGVPIYKTLGNMWMDEKKDNFWVHTNPTLVTREANYHARWNPNGNWA